MNAPGGGAATGAADRFWLVLATWFGSGLSPFASGTAGTLAAIPLYLALARVTRYMPWLYVVIVAALTLLAVRAAAVAGRVYGEHDDGRIVIDEVVGFLIALIWIPASPVSIVAAFVLFRVFDIGKFGLVRYFDRHVPNAWGTVFDDVFAGLHALLVLHALHWWRPDLFLVGLVDD